MEKFIEIPKFKKKTFNYAMILELLNLKNFLIASSFCLVDYQKYKNNVCSSECRCQSISCYDHEVNFTLTIELTHILSIEYTIQHLNFPHLEQQANIKINNNISK